MKGGLSLKKLTLSFLIFLCISLNIFGITSAYAVNTFKEGVYKVSDFNLSPNNLYTVQNISKNSLYLVVFDESQTGIQAIKLAPNSLKYNLVPLNPDYRIVIVGNGEAFIS